MNQRSEIMNELLVLKNELNESNKFANQQTQLVFEIEEEASGRQVLFAKLSGDQKVRICDQPSVRKWAVAKESKYQILGDFILKLIIVYDDKKHLIQCTFNEFFYIEFNQLLGFK